MDTGVPCDFSVHDTGLQTVRHSVVHQTKAQKGSALTHRSLVLKESYSSKPE